MRVYIRIVFTLMFVPVFANHAESGEEVWIDGNSFYKSIKHQKQSTLYFNEWSIHVNQFLDDDDYYVALQLSDAFDPLPTDNITLPSLQTLAAIGDEEIRKEYYRFFESFGRSNGINYMVLPDTAGYSVFEKEVLQEASAHSPFYFLNRSFLSYSLPESKKEFENEAEEKPTIWIAEQDESTKKLNKWGSKLGKDDRFSFYERLRNSRKVEFIPTYELPFSLARSIYSSSIVAIDTEQRLPIRDHVITYLGSDSQLKKRLEQYAQVLDYRSAGVTTIVDLRNQQESTLAEDIVLKNQAGNEERSSLIIPEIEFGGLDILIAKMLFGSHAIIGRSDHPFSKRIQNQKYLGYTDPSWEGMSDLYLQQMDTLAADAIKKFATPGIQLAVVKNGSLVVERSYGHFTYDSLQMVNNNTLYDIASITKVIGTLPAIALLVDQRKISLDDSLSIHLPEFSKSNKSQITIRQLLAHNAGLLSYVPFWSMMMGGDRLDAFYYKTPEDEANDIRTYGLEPHPSMLDSLKSFIVKSKLIKNPGEYNYSDLGFMILHLVVEQVSGMPFDKFLTKNFYQPMDLKNTFFNPKVNGLSLKNIAPTEYDQRYRNYQVWGEVHDRNALVFGGVAGHAGLFSNATDIAKMMSMFLNNGYYGGKSYLSKETLDQFNFRHFENNRRGLGWDKKDGKKDAASSLAGDHSFGHTGFTGTMVWADPEEDLIYVFLSNRIYPDANNWKLGELNTRTNIHEVIYHSLKNSP